MNERYLFRGKRISEATDKTGKWITGYYTGCDNGVHYIKSDTTEYYSIDPDTLGQCTGLRDRNGTLIFEGDILKWDKPDLRNPETLCGNVTLEYDFYKVCIDDSRWWFLSCVHDRGCEVIGNVYDVKADDA